MLCPSCNAQNRDDAKFCKGCGQSLRIEQAASVAEQATTPEQESAANTPEKSPGPAPVSQENNSATVQPSQLQAPVEAQEEDPSQVPTLILTPEMVMAHRSRFWRMSDEEVKHEPPSEPTFKGAGTLPEASPHPADMPTIVEAPVSSSGNLPEPPASSLADMPTLVSSPVTEGAQSSSPGEQDKAEASSFGTIADITLEESAEQKEVNTPMTEQSENDAEVVSSGEAGASQSEGGEAALLNVGDMLIGRYEITQVLGGSATENTYQVIDRQGYQHCWNCGSDENAEGDEFCNDCGASMLNVPYVLHEFPANAVMGDESVLNGTIVNTFMEQGHTYVVAQPSLQQSIFPNGVQLLAAGNSDAGDMRRSDPNEDSTLVLQLQRVHESHSSPSGIFIVADGLGGHDSGQVASRMAVNIIAERIVRELLGAPLQAEREGKAPVAPGEDDLVGLLRNAIEDANLTLCQKNQQDKTDMGSTLTGFMVVGEQAYIVNVGDSRTYMVRGSQIYQLTTDHSLVNQLVAGGLIEPDDIYTHPRRSQILRSLGDNPNVQVDVFKQQLSPGDILLSCSDGLWEMIRNPQIESILNNAPDPQAACAQLIETANANGGEDNVSAVVVFVR